VIGSQGVERPTDAGLHLRERLAAGEAEAARVALHGAPLGELGELLQLGSGPVAEVGFEQPLGGLDPEPQRLRDRSGGLRSEEHTSELQSLMRLSYAVFCL